MQFLREQVGLSQRRACRLVGLARSSAQYRRRREDGGTLVQRLRALAERHPRYGYRRLTVCLRREGLPVNHKRVYRLYRAQGLALRRRSRKHAAALRVPPPAVVPIPNRRWSMDFVTDALSSGRQFRLLAVLDDGLRKCLGIEVDVSLPGVRVTEVLERLITEYGTPELIVIDNGPEFAGRALDQWAYARGIRLHFIDRGKPTQNAYVESFAGKLRDECLNAHWFLTLTDARSVIEQWRREYNEERPHSALDYLPPEEFARQHAVEQQQLDPRVPVTL